MHYKGQGVPHDVAIAELWFIKAAEHGDLQSQVNLGMMYENGLSVPEDGSRSAFWFLRAAGQGDRQSQMRIGEILYLGDGVPKDYVEADKWWKVALSVADDSYTTWMRPIVASAERKMNAEQLAEANRRATAWKMSRDAKR